MYKLLEISVYGPFGSIYEVQVDFFNKKATYKKQDAMFVDVERINVEFDETQLINFSSKLDEYKVLEWEEEYTHPTLKKGYNWEIRVVHGQTRKQSSGVVEVPEEWDKLCKELTLLLGTRFG